jgi:hypothetical protein
VRRPLRLVLFVFAAACGSRRTRAVHVDDARCPEVSTEAVPDAGGDDGRVLMPTVVAFGGLPINSIRYEVVGYDAAADICVHAIWDFSNNGMSMKKHCDDFFEGFPYVFIENGVCTKGTPLYSGNAHLVLGKGCVVFAFEEFDGLSLYVDVKLRVKGPAFTGTIKMKSP